MKFTDFLRIAGLTLVVAACSSGGDDGNGGTGGAAGTGTTGGAGGVAGSENDSGIAATTFQAWARREAIPLRTVETEADTSDLRALDALIGDARIVALGEAAHGAHQPLAFRNRLLAYLVQELGFTAIAIEDGVTEARHVYDFVLGGAGNIDDVVNAGFTWGFSTLAANEALVSFLRDHNANAANAKVRFYGIDMSGANAAAFPNARIAADEALAYLQGVDTAAAQTHGTALDPYLGSFSSNGYRTLQPAQRDDLKAALTALEAELTSNSATYIAASSELDFSWAHRNAVAALQLEALFAVEPPPTSDGSLHPDFYLPMNVRDQAMMDNLRWVLEREGHSGRVLLFAHNAHVHNSTARGTVWTVLNEAPTMLGVHMRAAYGADVVILGTSASKNGPALPQTALDPESIDAGLAMVGLPLFAIDLREAQSNPAAMAWLARERKLRANFQLDQLVIPGTAFDGFIYVDTFTGAASR